MYAPGRHLFVLSSVERSEGLEEEVENKTGCVWSTQLHEGRSALSSAHSGRMMALAINGIASILDAVSTIV